MPFELDTGRVIDEVWARWLALDPVRMAPLHAEALRSMRRIYSMPASRMSGTWISGRRRLRRSWMRSGVSYTLELFDAAHGGSRFGIRAAIHELVTALSS